jgi:hypothetical protein
MKKIPKVKRNQNTSDPGMKIHEIPKRKMMNTKHHDIQENNIIA